MSERFINDVVLGAAMTFAVLACWAGVHLYRTLAGYRLTIRWRLEDDPDGSLEEAKSDDWAREGGLRR